MLPLSVQTIPTLTSGAAATKAVALSDLSPDQRIVYDDIVAWFHDSNRGREKCLTMGGLAGCLSGDTIVKYNRGARVNYRTIALRDLYLKFNGMRGNGSGSAQFWTNLSSPTYMLSHWPDGSVSGNRIVAVFESGVKPVLQVDFEGKRSLTLTKNHPILTPSGAYVNAGDLDVGDEVVACGTLRTKKGGRGRRPIADRPPRVIVNTKYHPIGAYKKVRCNGIDYEYMRVPRSRLVVEAAMNDVPYDQFVRALKRDAAASRRFRFLPRGVDVHHVDEDTMNDSIENLQVLPHGAHAGLHGEDHASHWQKDFSRIVKVKRIRHVGKEMTYDVQMEPPANNFVANGIFVHNSGKSTLVSVLVAQASKSLIAACAYTGKASSVLNQKLKSAGLKPRRFLVSPDEPSEFPEPGVSCSTIHSLIYMPVTDEKTGKVLEWKLKPDLPADLIIVDEASMVGADMWKDLVSFGVPILAVGDHGQLPPIGAGSVNLMKNPDLKLEKIHRQAEDNPIIRLAHHVRDGRSLSTFRTNGDLRVQFAKSVKHIIEEFGNGSLDRAILCGYNRSRVGYNQMIRDYRKLEGPFPDPGDVVICLKNRRPIFNGMRGVVVEADLSESKSKPDPFCRFPMTVDFPYDGMRVSGLTQSAQFNEEKTISEFRQVKVLPGSKVTVRTWDDVGLLYDYGYAMTVHKSQGSQFEKVALVMEPFGTEDEKVRWAYTGITRASETLYVVTR